MAPKKRNVKSGKSKDARKIIPFNSRPKNRRTAIIQKKDERDTPQHRKKFERFLIDANRGFDLIDIARTTNKKPAQLIMQEIEKFPKDQREIIKLHIKNIPINEIAKRFEIDELEVELEIVEIITTLMNNPRLRFLRK
ncbi:MAG: hypothetical protein Q7S21_03390 [archaeon]|nr:hypothetical protein [archaeon]